MPQYEFINFFLISLFRPGYKIPFFGEEDTGKFKKVFMDFMHS